MRRILLTGAIQAGKTTFLKDLADHAEKVGAPAVGMVCPADFAEGEKIGIDLLLLPSRERMHLAMRNDVPWKAEPAAKESGAGAEAGAEAGAGAALSALKTWRFLDSTFDAANEHFSSLIKQGKDEPASLAIVDEIGPVELCGNAGVTQAVSFIDAGHYGTCVITMRPSLIEEALRRWPDAQVLDLEDVKMTTFLQDSVHKVFD